MEGNSLDLRERVDGWLRAAIRVVETPDGFVHIQLFVTGNANVEQFDREGRWLESDIVRRMEGGREAFEERDLVGVLVAFGVPEAEVGSSPLCSRLCCSSLCLRRARGGCAEWGWRTTRHPHSRA